MCPEEGMASGLHSVPARAVRSGFTLIELMIVVVVVAILAVVVMPSYQWAVMKARRTEAKSALITVAQTLERFSTENALNGYSQAKLSDTEVSDKVVAKATTESGYYELSFVPNPPTFAEYEVRAAPKNAQANDKCGVFRLNQKGERNVLNSFGKTKEECWQ